jgi:hypothetical protein
MQNPRLELPTPAGGFSIFRRLSDEKVSICILAQRPKLKTWLPAEKNIKNLCVHLKPFLWTWYRAQSPRPTPKSPVKIQMVIAIPPSLVQLSICSISKKR